MLPLFQALDKNENGVVEFEEFIKLMEERIDTRDQSYKTFYCGKLIS